MSDIKVGDKIKVTGDIFVRTFPLEYEVIVVPDDANPYLIMEHDGEQYGFTLDEVEKIEPESKYKFAVGDKVLVTYEEYGQDISEPGTVLFVDERDEGLPYRITFDSEDTYGDWYRFDEVSAVPEEQTIERTDHTALVEDADSLIVAFETIGGWPHTVTVLKSLRDALVEESYREGN